MKDSEFINLLNLYLDHEISASDAARLEAEVQSNSARRRVYQDYCRMQKACKILAQDFATDTAEADRKIVAFDAAQAAAPRRNNTFYIASTFAAAAACIAVVFVSRQHKAVTPAAPAFVQNTPTPEATVAPVVAAPAPQLGADAAPVQPENAAPARFANGLSLRRNAQSEALVAAATADADAQLAWIQNVRLAPIQQPVTVDQLRFDAAANQRTDNRTYTSGRQPVPFDAQLTAIRFQR